MCDLEQPKISEELVARGALDGDGVARAIQTVFEERRIVNERMQACFGRRERTSF
jgi:hypothetical protein